MYFSKLEQILKLFFVVGKFGSLLDCVYVFGSRIHALCYFRDNQEKKHFSAARLTRFQTIAQCSV